MRGCVHRTESEPQSRAEEEKDPSANGVGSRTRGQKEREDRDAEGDPADNDVVEVAAFSESDGVRVLVPPLQKSRPNISSGGSTKRKDDRERSRSSIGHLLASSLRLPLTRLRR